MNRNPVLTFCVAFTFTLVCAGTAVAQSAPPVTKPTSPLPALRQSIDRQRREAEALRRELDEIAVTRAAIAEELEKSKAVEDKSGVSIESFPEIVKTLQAKRIELIIDVAGLEAKRKAILAARAEKPVNSAIVGPLKKIIALHQDKLDQLRKNKASASEIRTAEMELLSSRIQLANANAPKPGSTLLTDALLNTSLAHAESKARLARTEALLEEILPARKQLEASKRLKEKATRYLEDETELAKQFRTVQRTVDRLSAELNEMKKIWRD